MAFRCEFHATCGPHALRVRGGAQHSSPGGPENFKFRLSSQQQVSESHFESFEHPESVSAPHFARLRLHC